MSESITNDDDLKQYIEAAMKKNPSSRTLCLEHQGKRIWVKKAEEVRNKTWLKFSRWLCIKLGLSILQPGADPDGKKAVRFEAGRLKRLAAKHLPVPHLVASGHDWLALEDGGRNLCDIMGDREISPEEKRRLAVQAAEMIAQFHAAGVHHGRPAVKDMAYDGKMLRLLDFEDGIMLRVSRSRRLQRDLLLFLQSLIKETGDPMLAQEALKAYGGLMPREARAACAYFAGFKGLYIFFRYFLRYFGSDLETTYQVLRLFHEEELN